MDLLNQAVAAPKSSFTPSPLQEAIFSAIEHQTDTSLIIEAVAGSGKTTTIVKGSQFIPEHLSTLFLAFNKSIVTELQNRLPPNIECKTFHSLGMTIIRKHIGRVDVNSRKVSELMDEIFGKARFRNKYDDRRNLQNLVGFAKANGHYYDSGYPELDDWLDLIDYHDLNFETNPRKYLKELTEVYRESLAWEEEIDFDDMLLFPIVKDLPFPQYDVIVCDEAQDLSGIQHEFLKRLIKPNGRIIAVGDTYQAIYGFRGADSGSMQRLKKTFSMTELPLNVSYRCSKAIRDMAKNFVPHFESLPDAPVGEIKTVFELPNPKDLDRETLVLCRFNAPLFRYGMKFLHDNVPVRLWTNLAGSLRSRIRGFKATQTKQWLGHLDNWYTAEKNAFEERGQYSRLETLQDTYETLKALAEKTTNVKQILKNLDQLTSSKFGPILSTVHKAKGHEAEHCLIVNYDSMPSRFAQKDWMVEQERNITYVALTRGKTSLTLHYKED